MHPSPEVAANSSSGPRPRRRRVGGLTLILIGIAVLFAFGFLVTALRKQKPPEPRRATESNQPIFGINEFINVPDGGVTFNDVYPPDGPADKAGLVGGDIITSFDGRPVKNKVEMMEILRQTPAGKTVEVEYLRDGEKKKTRLTTISREQFDQLQEAYEDRPARHGQLGFDDADTRVVRIAGSNISGVKLGALRVSGPATLAGLQEGDIVIEFDGVPIRTRGELVTRVRRAIPYSTVKVVVMRGAERLEIPVKLGKSG